MNTSKLKNKFQWQKLSLVYKKQETQDQLNDTVRLLELNDGENKDYTDELTDRITIKKNNIQIKMDNDEIEKTRKYMAKCNLEAETPAK